MSLCPSGSYSFTSFQTMSALRWRGVCSALARSPTTSALRRRGALAAARRWVCSLSRSSAPPIRPRRLTDNPPTVTRMMARPVRPRRSVRRLDLIDRLTVHAADLVVVAIRRRVEALELDANEHGGRAGIVPHAEECLPDALDGARGHARVDDHGQLGVAVRHEDLAETDVLPLRVLGEKARVDSARFHAPGLQLGEHAFLVARQHFLDLDAGLLQGDERNRVADESVPRGEGDSLGVELLQVLDMAVLGNRDHAPDRVARPARDDLVSDRVELGLEVVVRERESRTRPTRSSRSSRRPWVPCGA